jgi:ABC-2 type transport system ATP-binding protein
MTDVAIEAKSLTVRRGGDEILRNINFSVGKGEVFALLGGNGAGKSTTLLTLLGVLLPSGGQAFVLGNNVADQAAKIRSEVAYLPEAATLYAHLSALENIEYFLALAGVDCSQSDIDSALDRVALDVAARGRRLDQYSKGMRQKTAIALALLRDTPILLLDEPTSGLDPVAIDEFNRLVTDLAAAGRTVLMVTHDVYGACQIAHRIALLHNGGLVGEYSANPGEQIDTETVHAAFARRQST